ncbi:hypothetical protein CAEBREN_12181 [Caenorhabditis brenneri]|uniref:Uncharacterized protein n=1 Tax=Caenorhabditis brenneri TaxID=135651 RepID=G0NE52_CAEBE|nr:hypothetical protein CAEBREN_12181 [Caenorhabditis brenneri]
MWLCQCLVVLIGAMIIGLPLYTR